MYGDVYDYIVFLEIRAPSVGVCGICVDSKLIFLVMKKIRKLSDVRWLKDRPSVRIVP